MISTKEKILLEALTLFSKNSYDAITVNQIAQNQLESRLHHCINIIKVNNIILYDNIKNMNGIKKFVESLEMNGIALEQEMYRFINIDENMFPYFLHDEFQSKFEK